jgi:hypothetical protein
MEAGLKMMGAAMKASTAAPGKAKEIQAALGKAGKQK